MKDYYDILGIAKDASQEDIKKAYKKMAFETHPDRNPENAEASARFVNITEAYQVLSDPNKKAQYDNPPMFEDFRYEGPPINFGFAESLFSEFFGRGNLRHNYASPIQINGEVQLDLKDTLAACTRTVVVAHLITCKACNGDRTDATKEEVACRACNGAGHVMIENFAARGPRVRSVCMSCNGVGKVKPACVTCHGTGDVRTTINLTITIPAGIPDGSTIQTETRTGQKLYILIRVNMPLNTHIDSNGDVHKTIFLTYPQCLLGGTQDIEMIDGTKGKINLPSDLKPGQQIRIRSRGMPIIQQGQPVTAYTDMLLEVNLVWPATKATETERSILEQLQQLYAATKAQ
jgi:molecular chaperone DnaJ